MENGKHVVLSVDDDPSTSGALRQKLENEGFIVDCANNGAECLSCIEKRKPDIILLDILMPVMGGMETLKNLKSNDPTKDIPIVVLTNSDSDEKISEALANDAQDYLLKTDQTLESIVQYVKNKLS